MGEPEVGHNKFTSAIDEAIDVPVFRMPSRLALRPFTPRSAARFAARPSYALQTPTCLRLTAQRTITSNEKPLPEAEKGQTGPNEEQLGHVSEEAAAISKVTGGTGPELDQGTPVQEVLQRDEKAQENAPKVMQDDKATNSPKGSRPYSTSARRRAELAVGPETTSVQGYGEGQGHIFGLPTLPLPSGSHMKHRYDPVVTQVTKLIMQDGKLSVAQRNMSMILERLRTAGPPTANARRPLLPGAPPTSHLPLNPILYLTLAIDSVAPLMRIRSQKGAAGGGAALQLPVPLSVRQRRRTAVQWILDAVSKRRSAGSGRTMFAHKLADELISIVEGKSGVWERRNMIHKVAVNARANLGVRIRRR